MNLCLWISDTNDSNSWFRGLVYKAWKKHIISTKVIKAQFGKTVSGQTWFHINKEMVWNVCVRNQNTTFWSYAESNLFYLCLSFTSTCLKFLSFIQTADTPTHHHKSLFFFFFQHYQEGKILNFQNSTILVLLLCCNWDCISRSFICSLHKRSTAGQFGCVRSFLLNPVGKSLCWKHLHVIPQACPLQNSTAAHKHDYSSTPELK